MSWSGWVCEIESLETTSQSGMILKASLWLSITIKMNTYSWRLFNFFYLTSFNARMNSFLFRLDQMHKINFLLKVAFSQKGLMHLSFLQTDEPNYLPELELKICFHSKWLNNLFATSKPPKYLNLNSPNLLLWFFCLIKSRVNLF